MKSKIKILWLKFLGFFPTRLPTGMSEFDAWYESLLATYGPDCGSPSGDSVKFALAGAVLHLGPTEARKAKRFFGKLLHKGAASQIAYGVMQALKDKQAIEQKAVADVTAKASATAQLLKSAEATAAAGASDGPKQS